MVIAEVLAKNSAQVSLDKDDDMNQTASADGSDNTFTKWILPGRARCSNNFLNAQALTISGTHTLPLKSTEFRD
jgi:hypothetical protein